MLMGIRLVCLFVFISILNILCFLFVDVLWSARFKILTVICRQECGFVYIVFDIDRLPVEHCCGDDLSIGPVDGQPVCRVIQLWIPKDTQRQINREVSAGVPLFTNTCAFSLASVHTKIASTYTHSQNHNSLTFTQFNSSLTFPPEPAAYSQFHLIFHSCVPGIEVNYLPS